MCSHSGLWYLKTAVRALYEGGIGGEENLYVFASAGFLYSSVKVEVFSQV